MMLNMTVKTWFLTALVVAVRFKTNYDLINLYFYYYFGRNSLKMKLESLSFRDRFDILLEKRLSPDVSG